MKRKENITELKEEHLIEISNSPEESSKRSALLHLHFKIHYKSPEMLSNIVKYWASTFYKHYHCPRKLPLKTHKFDFTMPMYA